MRRLVFVKIEKAGATALNTAVKVAFGRLSTTPLIVLVLQLLCQFFRGVSYFAVLAHLLVRVRVRVLLREARMHGRQSLTERISSELTPLSLLGCAKKMSKKRESD